MLLWWYATKVNWGAYEKRCDSTYAAELVQWQTWSTPGMRQLLLTLLNFHCLGPEWTTCVALACRWPRFSQFSGMESHAHFTHMSPQDILRDVTMVETPAQRKERTGSRTCHMVTRHQQDVATIQSTLQLKAHIGDPESSIVPNQIQCPQKLFKCFGLFGWMACI